MNVTKTVLSMGTHPSGINLEISAYSCKQGEGKKVYIQSGIHGGELTYWIIDRIYSILKQTAFVGEVMLVPTANPVSWMQRLQYNTVGKFDLYDGSDWNRHFPGSVDGSLSDRIAFQLHSLANSADVVIDLHTAKTCFPFVVYAGDKNKSLAQLCGLEYNNCVTGEQKESMYKTTLAGSVSGQSIVIECGGHDEYNEQYIQEVTDGIIRILIDTVSLEYIRPEQPKPSKIYTQFVTYKAPDGAFIKFHKKVGEAYKQGDILFELYKPYAIGETEKVLAKEDGLVHKITPTHIYWPGDVVFQCLLQSDIGEFVD